MGWLRDEKADISKYLPEFVRGDPALGRVLTIESEEHERQRLEIRDLLAQAFIETATWGLGDWERILGLKPDAGDSYEQRRNRILLKLQGKQTSTVAFLTKLIKRYCTEKSKVTVIEDNEHYMFHAEITDGTVSYADNLLDALNTYKPAHLGFDILMRYLLALKESDRLRYGLADCHLGRKRIRIPPPDDASIKARSGVGYFRTGRMRIGAGEEPPPSVLAQRVGVLAYRIGRVRIPYNPADKGQAHESRLYPAGAGYHTGLASLTYGRRHIGLSAPAEAESMSAIGMASATIGRKRIRSAAPPESYTEPRGGRVILRTGRITIQVSKEETTQ